MSFDHFQNQRHAIELSSAVSKLISNRIRPTRAFSSGRKDAQADEENQQGQPDPAVGSRLLGSSMSSGEIIQSISRGDQELEEKDETEATEDAPEINEESSPNPKPDGDKENKKLFGIFNDVKPNTPFTIRGQLKFIIQANFLMNLCFFACPVGFVLYFNRGPSKWTFVINFISTIPANFLGNLAMTEIGLRVPRLIADWMSISVGNLIQFISCIVLLRSHEYVVLQTSITGSILANILFFLGLSIVAGCAFRDHQNLNRTAAHMASNLLSLSSTSLLIPTASELLSQTDKKDLVRQSRGVAIVLVVVYWCFVFCEQWTHWETFTREPAIVPESRMSFPNPFSHHRSSRTLAPDELRAEDTAKGEIHTTGKFRSTLRKRLARDMSGPEKDAGSTSTENKKPDIEPHLHFVTAILLLAIGTTLLYFHIEYSVQSLDAVTKSLNLTKTFIGLVIFPLANCDYAPIMLAYRGKLGQTITQTVGKSIQTALLVMPSVILIAWIWQLNEVTLVFDGFEVISLFAAVLLLNLLLMDAKLHWVQGVLLLADWCLIAIAAFFATNARPKQS